MACSSWFPDSQAAIITGFALTSFCRYFRVQHQLAFPERPGGTRQVSRRALSRPAPCLRRQHRQNLGQPAANRPPFHRGGWAGASHGIVVSAGCRAAHCRKGQHRYQWHVVRCNSKWRRWHVFQHFSLYVGVIINVVNVPFALIMFRRLLHSL